MAPKLSGRLMKVIAKKRRYKALAREWVRLNAHRDWVTKHRMYMAIGNPRIQERVRELMAPSDLLWGNAFVESLRKRDVVISLPDRPTHRQRSLAEFFGPVVHARAPGHPNNAIQVPLHHYFAVDETFAWADN